MRINLFGYTLIVELQKPDILELQKRDLVVHVEALAKTYSDYERGATKIARIRAYRNLTNSMLKESKEWVESHFA